MKIYPPGWATGNYVTHGDVANADCVLGHEFGYGKRAYGSVNIALAEFIIAKDLLDLPLFLNQNIAGALRGITGEELATEQFNGKSIDYFGTSGQGTWGELDQASRFMDQRGFNNPLIVAQAYHVGRVVNMANLWQMNPIVVEGLPRTFDPESEQEWTRSEWRWRRREVMAAPALYAMIYGGKVIDGDLWSRAKPAE